MNTANRIHMWSVALAAVLTASALAEAPVEPAKPGSAGEKPVPEQPGSPNQTPALTPGNANSNAPANPSDPIKPGSPGEKPTSPDQQPTNPPK